MVSLFEVFFVIFLFFEFFFLLVFFVVKGLMFFFEVVVGFLDVVRGLNFEEGLRVEFGRYFVVGRRDVVFGLFIVFVGLFEIINGRNIVVKDMI